MRVRASVLFAAVFLFLCTVPAFAADQGIEAGNTVTVTGNVEKAALDEKGNVIAVEIWAEGGDGYDYYLVNDSDKGNELIPLVGKRVRASGTVEEDEDGNKILTITGYSVVK